MPDLNNMSLPDLVQDLNLDYSDRNRDVYELNKRRNTVYDFRVGSTQKPKLFSDSSGSESEASDAEADDDDDADADHEDDDKQFESDDDYFFDKGLDFNDPCYLKYRQLKDAEKDEYIDDHGLEFEGAIDSKHKLEKEKKVTESVKEKTKVKKQVSIGEVTEIPEDTVIAIPTPTPQEEIIDARRNDREEIRKKLAMGDEDEYYEDNETDDVSYKKPSFQSRLHSGLQICFMNESPGDTDSEGRSPRQHEFHDNMKLDPKVNDLVDSDNNLRTVQDLNQTASTSAMIQNCSPPRLKPYKPEEGEGLTDFQSKQEQLQNEAKLALAQAGTMAHMQLEIEKQVKKKSPMAEMVGIPGLGERRRKKLSLRQLQEMNLAQIQVLYNDLQTQIESLNEELVHLLMERDELHMEQDSMLVDIEDLTRRAEELADKAKDVKNNVKGKLPTR